MSRQSKQAKRAVLAAEFTEARKQRAKDAPKGQERPKFDGEQHHGYRVNAQRQKALEEFLINMRLRVHASARSLGAPKDRPVLWR